MRNTIFPMSDNWWMEGGKAYFCGAVVNAVFCVDLITQQCKLIARIPECNFRDFRQYPYCIKRGDMIFCLPGSGCGIWCYDIRQVTWEKIELQHESQFVLYNKNLYKNSSGIVWLSEFDTGRVLKINLEKKIREKEYYIRFGTDTEFGEYVFVKDKLYCVVNNTIQCFDSNNDEMIIYEEPEFSKGLFTICHDGVNFWLSGYAKEIYVWNPEEGIVKVLTEFPERFGVYYFNSGEEPYVDCHTKYRKSMYFFSESIILGKYVWYIPSQSDSVIYIDRENYKVNLLEFEKERETKESLQRNFAYKYLFQYIREDRYIVLYSIKNRRIFEIDTFNLCEVDCCYKLEDETVLSLSKSCEYYYNQKVFHETSKGDSIIFEDILEKRVGEKQNSLQNVGNLIYHTLS